MKRWWLGLHLVVAMHGAQAAVLTVCTEAAPDGFDAAQYTSAVTHDAVGQTIFDQLLLNNRSTGEPEPALAEKMVVAPDGLSYTAHLRKGVKFHITPWFKPTRDMNADDVMFSVNRLMDRKSPWRAITKGGFIAWDSYGPAEYIKSVEKLDDMTVRFHMKRPNASFLSDFANYNEFSVYSAEYGAQLIKAGKLELINTQPVGTGAWMFKSYQKDAALRLVAHPEHWRGKQAVDLVFAITLDANVRVQRLKAGECLVGSNMRAETLDAFKGSQVEALGRTALLTGFIPLNTQRKWLADKRFREALWLGFDKATWIKSVYAGRAKPASTFLPPAVWAHDATLPATRYDPDKAKALVKASGYDGTELEIATRIGGSIDGKRAAELLQADWARIGVKTRIQMIEWGEMLKRTGSGNFDISFLNWVGGVDPDSFFTPVLTCAALAGGNNRSQWCHKEFDTLIDTALATQDRAKRIDLYKKAQRILYDEVPQIPTVYPEYFTAVNKRVKGFVAGPLADLDFRGVSLDR